MTRPSTFLWKAEIEVYSGMDAWVYILLCADGSYYTGLTRVQEVTTRLSEHELAVFVTALHATRRPVKLRLCRALQPHCGCSRGRTPHKGLVTRKEGSTDQQ